MTVSLRPGTNVSLTASAPARGVETPTGTLFLPGFYNKGRANTPVVVKSMAEFVKNLGDRRTDSLAYDAAEFYFSIGGKRIVASRVVGPAPTLATAKVFDQLGAVDPGDVSLVFTAREPGSTYQSGLRIVTTQANAGAALPFVVQVTHVTDGVLETSPSLADRTAGVAWALTSKLVTASLGASAENPRAATTAFTGGSDDAASAVDAHWQTALDALTKGYGPGQVALAGRTTAAAHLMLARHALANKRHALADLVDKETEAGLKAAIVALRTSDPEAAQAIRFYSNWMDMPGLSTLPGTTRAVPPSAIAAGLLARNDGAGLGPNRAAAGVVNGVVPNALGIRLLNDTPWTPQQVNDLNAAGVNVIKVEDDQIVLWGNRTAVDPAGQYSGWLDASNARLGMAIAFRADQIAKPFVFGEINMIEVKRYGGLLRIMLKDEFGAALFPDPNDPRPDTAYVVDVDTPNTLLTMANGEINAQIGFRANPTAELVTVAITKRRITEAVA